tara:strand:- start:3256 stop:3834 length:579 start_codon:yes stop_codon:yes gene_type:complete
MSLRIVLAEDETIIRMDLREQLESLGYQVVADVADGETAVKVSRESRPDVVVMDIKMPGMDGISAAQKLTGETICPVVLVTAFSDAELIEKANEAGVMAYVMKPIRQGDLRPAIELAVSRFLEYRLLVDEVKDLAQRLETRKLLERAKGILMDSHKLTETQAFQRIQKISMDRRKSMKEIAEAILLADDLNA